jgi:hypothetical protein
MAAPYYVEVRRTLTEKLCGRCCANQCRAGYRRDSPTQSNLDELGKKGSIKIAGAMYDLATGMVEFVG